MLMHRGNISIAFCLSLRKKIRRLEVNSYGISKSIAPRVMKFDFDNLRGNVCGQGSYGSGSKVTWVKPSLQFVTKYNSTIYPQIWQIFLRFPLISVQT